MISAGQSATALSLVCGATALLLDRVHKFWQIDVSGWHGGEFVHVTDFFDYVLVWNTGISYGLLGDVPPWVLGGVIITAIALLGVWWLRAPHPLVKVGLMFCLGGAVSNALDRLLYGAVADFFHFHWQEYSFYIFNIADTAISLGVLLLVLDLVGIGRSRVARDAV